MNIQKHKWILYLILITIVATISVQFFWNFKNYEQNKQRIVNEIQLSLDNAVEEYYASLAKRNFLTIIENPENIINTKDSSFFRNEKNLFSKNKTNITLKNLKITTDDSIGKKDMDSLFEVIQHKFNTKQHPKLSDLKNKVHIFPDGKKQSIKYFRGKKAADSIKLIKSLKPIFISFLEKELNYNKIDSLIKNQLLLKKISTNSVFFHLKSDTTFYQTKDTLEFNKLLFVSSKSTYVKNNETFKLFFENPNLDALKRSSSGILLSLFLSLLIISCLFYLLKIIHQQKELAIIKNDLISNITHEFKTPIATVSTAIEAIENFNVLEDKAKTKKYLSMAGLQLKKLHQMVEKLLETATLDSENLLLKKESIDVVDLIHKIVQKHQLLITDKEINFSTNLEPIYLNVDVFHFENCISNLIDNAVKYGGKNIEVNINSILNSTEISVADDGNGIDKNQQEKIFDKFYRVPKGNTHNVKGFGIGLYYCKKIIEKHNGSLQLTSTKNTTIFKISIPNE